jgi:hypothetical protein
LRNIFDQYEQPENRLTHALVCTLAEEPRLLRRFIRDFTHASPPSGGLYIVEQQRPGEQRSRSEGETSGLPDAWIYSEEGWALILECKVAAGLSAGQLRRHLVTAAHRGFTDIRLLVITARGAKARLPDRAHAAQWTDVYAWLVRQSRESRLARRCADYFEILEAELPEDYLREGTLTAFSGIPFNAANPYSYLEAKRLLKLALDELRKNRKLAKTLGMDPRGTGRGAITGRESDSVWDFLRLKRGRGDQAFTHYPHMTLAIKSDLLLTIVTVPHGIRPELRRHLVDLGADGFRDLFEEICKRICFALRKDKGAAPWMEVLQRRYLSQRSIPIVDARMEFDLRTAFQKTPTLGKKAIKPQPQWLDAAYRALTKKNSNLQLTVGAAFPYGRSSSVSERTILSNIAETWLACLPLLKAMKIN